MATKANPGDFDCYGAAAPDEPIFVLRSTDPLAPYMVKIWATLRSGYVHAANAYLEAAAIEAFLRGRKSDAKYFEAMKTAADMQQWLTEHPK